MTIWRWQLALASYWAYENKSRALSGPELKTLDY